MDKIEKIRKFVKELQQDFISIQPKDCSLDLIKSYAGYAYLDKVLSFLDTLSEEPDNGLEEAAEEYYDEMWDELGGFTETRDGCYDIFFPSKAIRDTFKAGAEWKESQMPMPEDTVLFQKGVAEGRRLEREDMLGDAVEGVLVDNIDGTQDICLHGKRFGQKVRIIVIKDESK